jgi:hypothetical protein
MDFRDILYPNDLTIYCRNLRNLGSSLYYGKSTAAQEITEGEPVFAVEFNTQLFNRNVIVEDNETKFYPENGTINASVISEVAVVEPDGLIIDQISVAIKIIQYDKDDAIKRESVPSYLSFLPNSNYKSSRFTLNTSLFCEMVEGDYISVVAYPAQTASENFTVLIVSANLQINTI